MSGRHHSRRQSRTITDEESRNLPSGEDKSRIDPRAFGLVRATYGVAEALDLLSIGRTSLYAAVKRGELTPIKFGKKTLFCAVDIAAFLTRLKKAAIASNAVACRQRGA